MADILISPLWTEKELLTQLPASPKIFVNNGQHYFKCIYSKTLCASRFGFARSCLYFEKEPSKVPDTIHGAFRDANCAAAWLRVNEARLPADVSKKMRHHILDSAGRPDDFFPAPPVCLLKEHGGTMDLPQWLENYNGPIYPCTLEKAEDAHHARELKKERERKKKEEQQVPKIDISKPASIVATPATPAAPMQVEEKKKSKQSTKKVKAAVHQDVSHSPAPAAVVHKAAPPAAPAASAASSSIRGGTSCVYRQSRGGKGVSEEVHGGAFNALGKSVGKNLDRFETSPNTYAGSWSLRPAKDKKTYVMEMSSVSSDAHVSVAGVEVRNPKKRERDADKPAADKNIAALHDMLKKMLQPEEKKKRAPSKKKEKKQSMDIDVDE